MAVRSLAAFEERAHMGDEALLLLGRQDVVHRLLLLIGSNIDRRPPARSTRKNSSSVRA